MVLIAALRRAVVVGSVLECLAFGTIGAYTFLLGVALNGRVDAFANDLNFLGGAAAMALAVGFGIGAALMSVRWFEQRIVGARVLGAVSHLGATAVGAWASIWFGLAEARVDPTTAGYWSPWIAFAIGAVVIGTGVAVLASLFVPATRTRR